MLTMHLLAYVTIGIIAGFMSGMFGIGGGSVRIPLLNIAGLPLIQAFGINLFVIPFSSVVGAVTHRKNIDFKIALFMIGGGLVGSAGGAYFTGLASKFALAVIFCTVSLLTVVGIYLNRIAPLVSRMLKPSHAGLAIGTFILNFITGMRGGSGGALFPPFLRALKVDVHRSVATSLFVTIFTALIAVGIYWQRGDIPFVAGICVLVGSIIGVRVGSKLSLLTKSGWLDAGLASLEVLLAFLTLFKAL